MFVFAATFKNGQNIGLTKKNNLTFTEIWKIKTVNGTNGCVCKEITENQFNEMHEGKRRPRLDGDTISFYKGKYVK